MIERSLRESAHALFPPTPDLARQVRGRLPAAPDRRQLVSRRALVIALASLALVGTAAAGTALELVPGVRIQRVERLPELSYVMPPFGHELDLGEAQQLVPFAIEGPPELGRPDWVLVDRDAGGSPVVTLVYGDLDGAQLVLTQWVAAGVLFDKFLRYDARTELVDVGGAPGMWIEGGDEHAVFYRGTSGRVDRVGGYLAGNVLVWQRERISYRLEAGVGRDRALELAGSLRPPG